MTCRLFSNDNEATTVGWYFTDVATGGLTKNIPKCTHICEESPILEGDHFNVTYTDGAVSLGNTAYYYCSSKIAASGLTKYSLTYSCSSFRATVSFLHLVCWHNNVMLKNGRWYVQVDLEQQRCEGHWNTTMRRKSIRCSQSFMYC